MAIPNLNSVNTGAVALNVKSGTQSGASVARAKSAPADLRVTEAESASRSVDPSALRQAAENINHVIQSMGSKNLQFSVDAETDLNVVKVVDVATKEVIRQIPSEEVLAIAKALDKLQGLLINDKA